MANVVAAIATNNSNRQSVEEPIVGILESWTLLDPE
jgi:hypothetical protein